MGRPWTEKTNQAKFYYLVLPSVTTRVEDFVVCGEEHFILFNTKRFISKDLVGLTWSVHCIENSTKEQSGRNYTLNPRTPASPPGRQFLRNLRCNMFGLEGRTRRVRGRGRWRVQWRLSTVASLQTLSSTGEVLTPSRVCMLEEIVTEMLPAASLASGTRANIVQSGRLDMFVWVLSFTSLNYLTVTLSLSVCIPVCLVCLSVSPSPSLPVTV